jgi:hypothetical protein
MSVLRSFQSPFAILTVFIVCLPFMVGCGGKTAVVEQRIEEPTFYYEHYMHGINPQKVTSRIYGDGYVITTIEQVYAGEEKKLKGDFLSRSRVDELAAFFVSEGFFDIEPLSMPAIYGGEVITITFNHSGRSHTLKFLKGTKIPHSLEKCSDRLSALVQPLIED